MKAPPSDFKLLKAIRDRHHENFVTGIPKRQSEVFVPIDIPAIARDLGSTDHAVFGRLYYDLEERYGANAPGPPGQTKVPRKSFFTPRLGRDPRDVNCVNWPHLEAVLAGLWEQRRRDRWTFLTSTVSLAISIAALLISTGWL